MVMPAAQDRVGLQILLGTFSVLYGAVVKLRGKLYDRGILPAYRVAPLVVSVGNIEAGGTGKTPFTIALAQALKARGHQVSIVTRGYKGRLKGVVQVNAKHSAQDVGDEALLMAKQAGVPVIKSPDRVAGANYAAHSLGSTIVILDDAYQHRRIARDYNICLVSRDLMHEALLPLGSLREPAGALARADCIVYTKAALNDGCRAELVPEGLVNGLSQPISLPIGAHVLAFCGIAQPDGFFAMLRASYADVATMAFPDHHVYTRQDIMRIQSAAQGKDLIITTEKDLMRLNLPDWDSRLCALRVRMEISDLERIIKEIEAHGQDRGLSR